MKIIYNRKPKLTKLLSIIMALNFASCGGSSNSTTQIKDARDVALSAAESVAVKSAAGVIRQLGNGGWESAYETAVEPLALEYRIGRSMLGDAQSLEIEGTAEDFYVYFPCAGSDTLIPFSGEVQVSGEYPSEYTLTTSVSEGSIQNCSIFNAQVSIDEISITTETKNFKKVEEAAPAALYSGSHSFTLSGTMVVATDDIGEITVTLTSINASYEISRVGLNRLWSTVSNTILENGECSGSVKLAKDGQTLKTLSCAEFFKAGLELLDDTTYGY